MTANFWKYATIGMCALFITSSLIYERNIQECKNKTLVAEKSLSDIRGELLETALNLQTERELRANEAAELYELRRKENDVIIETVTEVVEKIVVRPVYRNECIDNDGLRLLNAQIHRSNSGAADIAASIGNAM